MCRLWFQHLATVYTKKTASSLVLTLRRCMIIKIAVLPFSERTFNPAKRGLTTKLA